ncbi:MAG: hypothetical protein AB7W44_19860, partial [Pyrinomonadaceae bacterium]
FNIPNTCPSLNFDRFIPRASFAILPPPGNSSFNWFYFKGCLQLQFQAFRKRKKKLSGWKTSPALSNKTDKRGEKQGV